MYRISVNITKKEFPHIRELSHPANAGNNSDVN